MDENIHDIDITDAHQVWEVEKAETQYLLNLSDRKTLFAMLMLKEAFERGRHAPEDMANPYVEPESK